MNLSFLKKQMLTTQIVSVCIECIAYVLSSTLAKKLTLRKCTNFSYSHLFQKSVPHYFCVF